MWGLIVIQWLHVLLGIFWFGSTLYLDVVVIPAVMTLPLVEQQRTVSKPLTRFSERVIIPAGLLVIVLGLVRGTIFGPVQSWNFLLGTAYGLTFLLALLAALATLAWGLLVLNRAARRLDTFPLADDEIRWNRGTRLRCSGAAGQALCPARTAWLLHHLHLHDPDALWPLTDL
jgi:uncharacterized membrane protein